MVMVNRRHGPQCGLSMRDRLRDTLPRSSDVIYNAGEAEHEREENESDENELGQLLENEEASQGGE